MQALEDSFSAASESCVNIMIIIDPYSPVMRKHLSADQIRGDHHEACKAEKRKTMKGVELEMPGKLHMKAVA